MPVGHPDLSRRDHVQTTAGVALGEHDVPGRKRTGSRCSINAETTPESVFPKIPDAISAWRRSRCSAAVGCVTGDIASTVFACRAFGFRPSRSAVTQPRLTTAHHDEVVAMHAADEARAVAVG